MSILKKLAGQTALYGISSIIGRVLNFLLIPFYTSQGVLNLLKFGIFTDIYASIAFLNIVYTFGLETTYFRFATRKDKDTNAEVSFNSSFSIILLITLLLSGSLILFSDQIAAFFKYPGRGLLFILMALILATDSLAAIPFARMRLEGKAAKYAFIKTSNIFLTIFFNLFFLIFCKQVEAGVILPSLKPAIDKIYIRDFEVEYILISNLLANLLQYPFILGAYRGFRLTLGREIISPMIRYSYPLMFMGLAGMVNEVMDRIVLKYWLPKGFYPGLDSVEAVGIYGACYKLSMFMSLAIQAFRYAADPFFFSVAENKNAPEVFARVMKYFVIVCMVIYVAVGANLDLLGILFLRNADFRQGLYIVPILLMANLFLGVYYNLSVWYKLTDKTHYGTIIGVIGAGITLAANFALIPVMGYTGSAWATLLCYFSMAVLSYYWGSKYFPVPYNLGSALFYILTGTGMVLVALYLNFKHSFIVENAVNLLIVTLFFLLIFLKERKDFKKGLRKRT